MLTGEDRDKILQLRAKGLSYQKIHERTGFSKDTIMKVCQNEKKRNIKEMIKNQTPGKGVHSSNTIEEIKGIIIAIDNLIKTKALAAEEKIKWKNRREKLQEMLRVEVNERIPKEVAKAVEKRDEVWNKHIEQTYAPKEKVKKLEDTVKAKDAKNDSQKKVIDEKNKLLQNKDYELDQFKFSSRQKEKNFNKQIVDLTLNNNGLRVENQGLRDYIETQLYYHIRQEEEELNQRKTAFNVKETKSIRHTEKQKTKLDKRLFAIEKMEEDNKITKKRLDDEKEHTKQREDDLDAKRTKFYKEQKENNRGLKQDTKKLLEAKDELETRLRNEAKLILYVWYVLNNTAEEQKIEKQRLQRWQTMLEKTDGFNKFFIPCNVCKKPVMIDVTTPEIRKKLNLIFQNYRHPECDKKEKQKPRKVSLVPYTPITLRPASDTDITPRPCPISDLPVVQSGYIPIAKPWKEAKVVQSIGEFIIQSGCSPITQSGAESFVVESNGQPNIQSGYSP
jgi:hypothetical protein